MRWKRTARIRKHLMVAVLFLMVAIGTVGTAASYWFLAWYLAGTVGFDHHLLSVGVIPAFFGGLFVFGMLAGRLYFGSARPPELPAMPIALSQSQRLWAAGDRLAGWVGPAALTGVAVVCAWLAGEAAFRFGLGKWATATLVVLSWLATIALFVKLQTAIGRAFARYRPPTPAEPVLKIFE